VSEENKQEKPKPQLARTFASPAYLVEVEAKTFGLYRNITQLNEQTGQKEKVGKPIGPLALFRECEGNEQPDLRTQIGDRAVNLKRIS
jgi:hypothetical protein